MPSPRAERWEQKEEAERVQKEIDDSWDKTLIGG